MGELSDACPQKRRSGRRLPSLEKLLSHIQFEYPLLLHDFCFCSSIVCLMCPTCRFESYLAPRFGHFSFFLKSILYNQHPHPLLPTVTLSFFGAAIYPSFASHLASANLAPSRSSACRTTSICCSLIVGGSILVLLSHWCHCGDTWTSDM